MQEVIARIKSGWAASRANVMADLITERLTGRAAESYTNAAMQHGLDTEPEARAAYAFRTDCEVAEIGLIRHPIIKHSHASPDGLIAKDGLLEIKCPNSAGHLNTLLGQAIPEKYITQIQWQLACSERRWCDYVSYDPRLPEAMRLFVKRVQRNDILIADLERCVAAFLSEINIRIRELSKQYGVKPVAPFPA